MKNERIYGENITIDENEVHEFWENRGIKEEGDRTSVNLTSSPDVSMKRDRYEKDLIIPKLGLSGQRNVIELGCGFGRFAEGIKDDVKAYVGIDFAESLISIANKKFEDRENIVFQRMSGVDIKKDELIVPPPYNLVMSMGFFVYLNESDLEKTCNEITEIADRECVIYIRESLSCMGQRLTLRNFYSEELNCRYNAIYRTADEYLEIFVKHFCSHGFTLVEQGILLDNKITPELWTREETNQTYFIFSRGKI